MAVELAAHQEEAYGKLKPGSILKGGVGSGKSRTALVYFLIKECGGGLRINGVGDYVKAKTPKDLYIITTARKRDTLEWNSECAIVTLSTNQEVSRDGIKVSIDSWNNIGKYTNVENAFFIFDEQRLVGSGAWVKAFLKITKKNSWILLSATPGDVWMDYIPVFIANGFYKNRTEFITRHVVFSRFSKYPKVDHYVDCDRLEKLKSLITVNMDYSRPTNVHDVEVVVNFDKKAFEKVFKKRWNIYKNKPIKNVSELFYVMRKVVNSDPSRAEFISDLLKSHPKIIVFYNFDYELEILKNLGSTLKVATAEWNGHLHEETPSAGKWLYLVQYTAGAEGWNCVETNCVAFYSQNYSYKMMTQAAGRIDRLNTLFSDLFYYRILSESRIDVAIAKALKEKRNFNQDNFLKVA